MNTSVIGKKQFAIRATLLLTLILTLVFTSSRLQADTGTCGGVTTTLPFTDVQGNIFFCSIASAFFSGLTNGTSATTYSPSATVTREQMAAFVSRTLEQSIRRYLVNGKESSKEEFANQPFIVAGAELPEEGTGYGFSQEELFWRWAAGTRHAPSFARAIGTIKLGQQLEGTDIAARAIKRTEATAKRLQGELDELSRETGLAIGTPEFLMQTHISRSALETPLLGSAILFDKVQGSLANPDFSGAFFPLPNAIPFPTLFGFNDKASGALVLGLCTLHDKTLFRGAAAFMIGGPTGVRFFLSDLGFNNRAASGISIGSILPI